MKYLFSPTTDTVLALFLKYPETKFYPNQIVQLTHKYPNSISQSLKRLENLGLLHKFKVGKYYFYGLNKKHPLLDDIKSIMCKLNILPSLSWVHQLQAAFGSFPGCKVQVKEKRFKVFLNEFELELKVEEGEGEVVRGSFVLKRREDEIRNSKS